MVQTFRLGLWRVWKKRLEEQALTGKAKEKACQVVGTAEAKR